MAVVPDGGSERVAARVSSRRVRAAWRQEFDAHVGRRYAQLVAEYALVTDDRARAVRLVHRALRQLWRGWGSAREHGEPCELVRRGLLEHAAAQDRARRWRRLPSATGRRGSEALVALRAVPRVQRRAMVLHHVVGRSVEQIAAAEGVSARDVQMRLIHGAHSLAHQHPATPTIPVSLGGPDGVGPAANAALDGWVARELASLRSDLAAAVRIPHASDLRRGYVGRRVLGASTASVGAVAALTVATGSAPVAAPAAEPVGSPSVPFLPGGLPISDGVPAGAEVPAWASVPTSVGAAPVFGGAPPRADDVADLGLTPPPAAALPPGAGLPAAAAPPAAAPPLSGAAPRAEPPPRAVAPSPPAPRPERPGQARPERPGPDRPEPPPQTEQPESKPEKPEKSEPQQPEPERPGSREPETGGGGPGGGDGGGSDDGDGATTPSAGGADDE